MVMWLAIYGNTKKGNFDGLCKQWWELVWDRISKKGNFDRLYKQVMWPRKNKNCRGIGAYISKSCDLPKKEIFDGLHKHFLGAFFKNYQKRKFDGLHKQIMWSIKSKKWGIAYISRSCDFLKKEILMDYISIFGRHFPKNYQKRKFDGLYKQITWPTKKWKCRAGWDAYIIKLCDLPKKGILMAN